MHTDYATLASMFVQRLSVRVGDMAVSGNPEVVISTYALGSCVGIVAYDPVAAVGGVLHVMLPHSGMSPEKAARRPALFANTGLPLFFHALTDLKAKLSRLRLFVVGGANVLSTTDSFQIAERNARATLTYLARQGLSVCSRDLGGTDHRTVHLEVASGDVTLHTPSGIQQFSLAAGR